MQPSRQVSCSTPSSLPHGLMTCPVVIWIFLVLAKGEARGSRWTSTDLWLHLLQCTPHAREDGRAEFLACTLLYEMCVPRVPPKEGTVRVKVCGPKAHQCMHTYVHTCTHTHAHTALMHAMQRGNRCTPQCVCTGTHSCAHTHHPDSCGRVMDADDQTPE